MAKNNEKAFTVFIDSELKKEALSKAILNDTTLKDVITEALKQYIQE